MSSDLSIDCYDEVENFTYDSEALEWNSKVLWNGREVCIQEPESWNEKFLKIIQKSAANDSLKDLNIEIIICDEEIDETQTLEDFLEENGFEFEIHLEIPQNCKSLKAHIKRIGKEAKKGAKKVGKNIEKAAKKVKKFVEEHKKECLIAGGILLGIGLGVVIAGTLNSNDEDKEEDDDSLEPDGINPAPSESVSDTEESLSPIKNDQLPSGIIEMPPSQEIPSKSPFGMFLENLENQLISSDSSQSFSTLSSQTQNPIYSSESSILQLLKTIRYGAELMGRAMNEPDLLDPNAPLNLYIKENSSKSPVIDTTQSLSSFFETMQATVQQGLQTVVQKINELSIKSDPSSYKTFLHDFAKSFGSPMEAIVQQLPAIDEKPKYFKTAGEIREDMIFTFVPGMNTSKGKTIHHSEYIRSLCPGNPCIEGIYHPTNGLFDLAEIIFHNVNGGSLGVDDYLIQKWTGFHERMKEKPNAKIFHTCHSQGAFHTKNALKRLPEEIRNRIIVVAIAPAVVITKDLCYDSFNYASKKDIVPVLGMTLELLNAGGQGETEREEMLINLEKRQQQLILLEPHEGATGFDHDFESPTFTPYLQKHFNEMVGENWTEISEK